MKRLRENASKSQGLVASKSQGLVAPFAMGFIALLLQVTAVRELLTVFSGNELTIGITLSAWLLLMGAGSLLGSKLRFRGAWGLSFLALGLLSVPSVFFMRMLRAVMALAPGEAVPLSTTLVWTFLTLIPVCLTAGLQFPFAVREKGAGSPHDIGGRNPAGAVYGLEAGGAFLGGVVFTFLLSGRLDGMGIALGIGILSILLSAYVLKRKAVILFSVLPLVFYLASSGISPPLKPIETVQSKYGEIWVSKLKGQFNIYSSGRFLYAYPDRQTEELRAHLPMTVHPSPAEILVIGGSPGALREFLKYPVKRIDFAETDPALIKVGLKYLSAEDEEALRDGRLKIITQDGRGAVVAVRPHTYDLVILNLPEPSTANMNRFYTVDFFREVKAALKEGGILSLSVAASPGYAGRRMRLANGSIYNSLKAVFGHAGLTTEEYGRLFASDSSLELSPDVLTRRFGERAIKVAHFHNYIITDAFAPLRVSLYEKRLSVETALNTDAGPVAYLYNLRLWAEAQKSALLDTLLGLKRWQAQLLLPAVLVITGAFIRKRRQAVLYYSIATTGYTGMALSLVIALGFQAEAGYVYERIGLLMALFMAGAALGAGGSATFQGLRAPTQGGGATPILATLRRLIVLEAASVLFALSLPLLFISEAFYYGLSLIAGFLAGCQFATGGSAASHIGSTATGGRFYALDLIGSFAGALLTAIIFIPLLGIKGALGIAAWAKAVSFFLVMGIYMHERR